MSIFFLRPLDMRASMQSSTQHKINHREKNMLATEQDAMREFATNIGAEDNNINRQWILTGYDVWVRNPHYTGPEQRHPEDDEYGD